MSVGIDFETITGQLNISGVDLRGPAWHVIDLYPLWSSSSVRGRDRVLPGAAGVRAYRRRRTVTSHALPMVIVGDVDRFGVPLEDCADEALAEQLQENIDYLMTNVAAEVATQAGTRAAILTMPDGTTRTGDLHVLGIDITGGRHDIVAATLNLSLPNGRLS